ncbi:bacillithiol system redox-active protein YtxJ [Pontibacillus salicampi]|uniref:Bacillithiol system redox-active protein YtxJ n=1 Tax=Pontibacillus salicampi TaxID=1449801 RepID=A0ABV6LIX2_9BACI
MTMETLRTRESFDKAIQEHDKLLLLKHSLTCPISASAKNAFEDYAKDTETPAYILPIQEARELSGQIADDFGVKHESPQALLFNGQQVTWNASHFNVTKDSLKKADE